MSDSVVAGWLKDYVDRTGRAPSIEEIQAFTDFSVRGPVYRLLHALNVIADGYAKRKAAAAGAVMRP
jgi:hypothetical protein